MNQAPRACDQSDTARGEPDTVRLDFGFTLGQAKVSGDAIMQFDLPTGARPLQRRGLLQQTLPALAAVLALSACLGGTAVAQSAKPKPQPAPAEPAAPAIAAVSASPIPTLDEGTAERMTAAILAYSALQVRGGWPTLPANAKLAPGAKGGDVAVLRQRLAITEDLPANRIGGDLYDEAVTAAVRRFQARHGLPETGSVGPTTLAALNVPVGKRLHQLAASIDRLAAMDLTFGARYVTVNIPSAVAEAVEGDHVVRRYVVVVGKTDRPSPTLATMITTVNLNPTWTVPLSIAKKDIITRMRKDPGYLARMHMRALDAQGNEIDSKLIDWNSDRSPNFTLRQDSGTWNALGALRIDMPNPYSVYMHDTNHKNLFGNDYRFESSGCTRVADVRDLAAWLLQDNPGWSRREIDAGIEKGERTDIRLTHKVPVAWTYLTGWVTRDGTVHFRDDVYGLDDKPALTAEAKQPTAIALARASGFVLESAATRSLEVKPVSYLDSQ
jgi:murein L,D-transpeptidase YcbB/YkuD